jgi:hypothetical protein
VGSDSSPSVAFIAIDQRVECPCDVGHPSFGRQLRPLSICEVVGQICQIENCRPAALMIPIIVLTCDLESQHRPLYCVVTAQQPRYFLRPILLLNKFGGTVALGKRGAQLSGNSQGVDFILAEHLDNNITRSFVAKQSDPIDELCRVLFARITESVITHETEDWPGYYDRLCALVCRVVAQSSLSADSKAVLTRRLIQHILELEIRRPRLKPE